MLELRGIEQKAELPGTDIDGPLFRVQTRTPAPSKKPLWARFEERRQHEEATSKDINMNTPNTSHVTESEDFLTLRHHPDASDSGIEDHFGDFSAILNYLQQERHRLASSELNGVSLPTQIDSASDIPQSPTATFRPSALSHEITTPPPLEESAAFSSRATTPRGPPSPGLAATRPTLGRDRKKSSSSSNSHNRLRKASRSSILAREAALNDSATFQSPRGPPLDRRAMLVSPDESVSTSNSRLFDTDSPSSAYNTVDTDLDALSLISPATSVTPAHFRDPAPSLKPSALNYSLASQTQNVTSPKKGSHKSTVSDELNEPTLSTRKPRFQKTSDRILSLLNKLSQDFPEDVEAFKRAKRSIFPTPKANPPLQEDDLSGPVCWSFVDNSNIVVGFLDYLRSHPDLAASASNIRKPKLDYHSLFAILERGRVAKRRVLVGSSPLHQSLDCAEDWSYEVQILSRVLKPVKSKPDFRPSPVRNPADLSTTDSGSGADDSDSEHLTKPQNHRNRRRSQRNVKEQRKSQQEQAVDEVLQLRMYEAVVDPRAMNKDDMKNTTLILASGDGAASEFSPQGFLGPVRAALYAGCQVEIVSWADGVSSVWRTECQQWPSGRCRIIYLDRFVEELVE